MTDKGPPLVSIGWREPIVNSSLHETRVGNIFLAIAEGQFHGFDLAVERFGVVPFTESKPTGNIQGHEDDQAMAVGWHFPNIVATVRRMDRVGPLRPIRC